MLEYVFGVVSQNPNEKFDARWNSLFVVTLQVDMSRGMVGKTFFAVGMSIKISAMCHLHGSVTASLACESVFDKFFGDQRLGIFFELVNMATCHDPCRCSYSPCLPEEASDSHKATIFAVTATLTSESRPFAVSDRESGRASATIFRSIVPMHGTCLESYR